jgi:hypothetical protein
MEITLSNSSNMANKNIKQLANSNEITNEINK